MKFTTIRLKGNKTIDLPIANITPQTPYILKAADGFGPPEVNIMLASSIHDSVIYQNRMTNTRQVILRIGLAPNYAINQTPSDLRESLYWLLESRSSGGIMIQLLNAGVIVAQTRGYVSKFETVPWGGTPEVQITFECDITYLENPITKRITGNQNQMILTNTGTARTPILFKAQFVKNAPHLGVRRYLGSETVSREYMAIVFYNFLIGDVVTINSAPGSKSVQLMRQGVLSNVIGHLAPNSYWPWLEPGENRVETFGGTGDGTATRLTELSYNERYWGV